MRKIWTQFILPMIDALEKQAAEQDDESVPRLETVWSRPPTRRADAVAVNGELERMDD